MTHPNDLLRLLSRLHRLEALPRTGWVVSGVPRPESISAHLYEVALVALWIADSIDSPVDTARVLRIALLHDVGEAITTDIPTPTKRLLGRDVVRAAEQRAVDVVLQDAPTTWQGLHEEYDDAQSLEARIVKAADTIQMLARALAYEAAHAGDTTRFWRPARDDHQIPIVRDVLDELVRRHESGEWFAADFD